jgi:hypothetical protein
MTCTTTIRGNSADPLAMTTTQYDGLKVDHVISIIHKLGSDTPTVFGMNFQVRSTRKYLRLMPKAVAMSGE